MEGLSLEQVVASAVASVGCELYSMNVSNTAKENILRVYIDRGNGISFDDCAKTSFQITTLISNYGNKFPKFKIEVSSPGVERSLSKKSHFRSAKGKKIKLKFRGENDNKMLIVDLIDVFDDHIIVKSSNCDNMKICDKSIINAKIILEV